MINRLRGLFQRYARTHRYIEAPGFDLSDSASGNGGQGYVDRVVLAGSRVTFIGWATAHRLPLTRAAGRADMRM